MKWPTRIKLGAYVVKQMENSPGFVATHDHLVHVSIHVQSYKATQNEKQAHGLPPLCNVRKRYIQISQTRRQPACSHYLLLRIPQTLSYCSYEHALVVMVVKQLKTKWQELDLKVPVLSYRGLKTSLHHLCADIHAQNLGRKFQVVTKLRGCNNRFNCISKSKEFCSVLQLLCPANAISDIIHFDTP